MNYIKYLDELIIDNNKFGVKGRMLHNKLQIKTEYAKWIKRKIEKYKFIENKDFTTFYNFVNRENSNLKSKTTEYNITLEMAKQLCIKEQSNCIAPLILKELLELNNDNLYIIELKRPELVFIDKLEHSLKPFNIKGMKQFTILSYRIDYYIKDLNIAIEYDENEHKNYTYEQQELRQAEIEKELGCRFIRVSDKNSDEYNIGLIIKELFQIAC